MQMNGENEYDVIKWGETCWEYANGQKIYVYKKKCPQRVVCPWPWAIYMHMTIIFKHLVLGNFVANQSQSLCGAL